MQVTWNQNKCSHAGVCVKAVPDVFKVVEGKFVIDTTQATEEEIVAVVKQCPSGALQVLK